MTLDDVYTLFDRVAMVDDRVVRTNPDDVAVQAEMWAVILAPVPLPFAAHAVAQHYARSPYALRPADIAERWRLHVRNRLERHAEPAPPGIDPTDELAYRRALIANRQNVSRSTTAPTPVRELISRTRTPTEDMPTTAQGVFDQLYPQRRSRQHTD